MRATAATTAYSPRGGFTPLLRPYPVKLLLTYMATLSEAVRAGRLGLFDLPEWERRRPLRPLYVTPELLAWADDTQRLHEVTIGGRTLFEHLVQFLCDFRCNPDVHYGDIRRMLPTKGGVWRMYPPGLRVYGWCPARHAFVAVTAAVEADTKQDRRLNDRKRDEVLRFAWHARLTHTILTGDYLALFPHQG